MQNNDQNERVRPKLESASELKGKKAAGKKKGDFGKRRIATLLSLVLLLGIAAGAYFVTDAIRPVEEEDTSSTETAEADFISLLEGHTKTDMAGLTVYENGEVKYSIVSNLQRKAEIRTQEGQAATASDAATPADAQEETVSAADAIPDYELVGNPGFTLDSSAVDTMTTYSFTMISAKLIEEDCQDLAKYGLAEPQLYVDYTYHDGTSMRLNFGDKVPAGTYYYVTLDDSGDVYMLYATVRAYFERPLEQLHVVPAMPVLSADAAMTYLRVEQRGQETIEVQNINEEDTTSVISLWLTQPIEYGVNSGRVEEVMTAASALTLNGYAAWAPDEAALAQYGLDDPYARVVVTDANGQTIDMTIGNTVEGDASLRYATVDETGDIYTVDASLLAFTSNCRVSYLVDQFAALINIKKINGFEIETAGKTYTAQITRTEYTDEDGNAATQEEFYFNGEYVEAGLFKDFYQVVIGTLFDKRIEDKQEQALDGEAAVTLRYHLTYTDEEYIVEYVEYDRDYYAVRKEGHTYFLVRKDKVQQIVDTAQLLENGEFVPEDNTIDPGAED